jgi:serine/threonine-protein kinase
VDSFTLGGADVQAPDSRIDRLLDEALDLPPEKREGHLRRACGGDEALRARVEALISLAEGGGFLDRPPLRAEDAAPDGARGSELGASIGPFRLVRLLGAGGMGEVYLAERVEGGFRQRVALKIARPDAQASPTRLDGERQILAGLEHPGIARLYDGGVTSDGRPYMAMEYVEGEDLLAFCASRQASLETRLELFRQVCAAVTFAHEHLVVHRDLKPSNVFVTREGQVKLLDFGIAKLLTPGAGDATQTAHLSPTYAAPEQLTGSAITTATDVYALGVTLYELLCGRSPWPPSDAPLASAVRRILDETPPRPSSVAEAAGPIPARRLRGDLDAVVAKAMRKEPAARYPDARALAEDLARHARNEPVRARSGTRAYVARRFVRRHWLPISASAALAGALLAGFAGVAWEMRRATREAARATATKDFLLGVFRASDPRIAQEKPRGQITAKELLDIAATRIEKEFGAQPDLQIELLGTAAEIYANLSDDERYKALQRRRTELARTHYGSAHPVVIEALLSEADSACARQDYARANALLAETDRSLNASAENRGLLRGDWWRVKARALSAVSHMGAERARALDNAVAIYERVAPRSNELASALNMISNSLTERGEHVKAKQVLERALKVRESATVRNEARIAELYVNLARKEEKLGDLDAADETYARAEAQIRSTVGERHATYWTACGYHARFLHMRGERQRADALFEQTLRVIPADWKTNTSDDWFREQYGSSLAAEGRATEAVPLLEAAHRRYLARPQFDYDVREVRRELGDAYDGAGRTAEARAMLKASRDEYVAKEAADSEWTLRIRER